MRTSIRRLFPSLLRRPVPALVLAAPLLLSGCSHGNRVAPFPAATTVSRVSGDGLSVAEGVPTWTSDGAQLFYPRLVGGSWRVYAADVASGQVTQITSPPPGSEDRYPEKSPTSQLVAFARHSTVIGGRDTLMLLDLRDHSLQRLLVQDGIYRPRWRPDGGAILFGAMEAGQGTLWIHRIDPSSITPGDTLAVDREYLFTQVSSVLKYDWNRTGTAVTYEVQSRDDPRIAVAQVAGSTVTRHLLTNNLLVTDCGTMVKYGNEYSPSFSPDGGQVAFASNYVIGTAPVAAAPQVATTLDRAGGLRCDEFAAWAPVGRQVVIEGGTGRGNQLWLRRVTDTNAIQLTALPGGVARFFAAWSPDARSLAALELIAAGADSGSQRVVVVKGF